SILLTKWVVSIIGERYPGHLYIMTVRSPLSYGDCLEGHIYPLPSGFWIHPLSHTYTIRVLSSMPRVLIPSSSCPTVISNHSHMAQYLAMDSEGASSMYF